MSWLPYFCGKKIGDALSRLSTLKHGETELSFSEISKKVIEGTVSPAEKSKFKAQQVVKESDYFKLYANGLITQRLKIKLLPHSIDREVTYPTTFPNETISIQVIGNVDAKIERMGQGNCRLVFGSASIEREIELEISGV